MNIILITLGSLLLIAGIAYATRKVFGWEVCAICAGVAGTWLWMLIGVLTENLPPTMYNLAIAVLMGGSVVGIAYQGEKRLPEGRSALVWKMVFIPAGFAGVLALLYGLWIISAAAFAIAAGAWMVFVPISRGAQGEESTERERAIARIKNQMKNCC